MTGTFRSFRRGFWLCALFAVLSGCDDTNGGAPERIFFGTTNIRACMPITVDVDLATASAVVARRTDGTLDCALDAALVGAGCTGDFDDVGGDTLHVVIDGCEVPAVASLFECGFSQGDVSALANEVSALCDCVGEPECHYNIFCDPTPGICVSHDADPSACEDCFNGRDDDGNGFVDCQDQNCHIENCGFGQTTITCSTTVTTTTTTLAGLVSSRGAPSARK